MKSRCLAVDRNEAARKLAELLSAGAVDESLKIRGTPRKILIPVSGAFISEDNDITEEDFDLRQKHTPPQIILSEQLREKGIDPGHAPKNWVRLGSSVFLKFPPLDEKKKTIIAESVKKTIGVRSVYEITGRVKGTYREPEMELISGPGGMIEHRENGLLFRFDPSQIMFSPGNVNIRTSMRNLNLEGLKVLDMFAGIGYFSMGLGKYSGASEIHACEVNPESYRWLSENIRLNKLEGTVRPYLGDSRLVAPGMKADVIVLGNFLSSRFVPHALSRLKDKGLLLMHETVPTDELATHKYALSRKLRKLGWFSTLEKEVIVKSFGPHMWHIYSEVRATLA